MKRVFDVVMSLALLLILSPVFLITAIAIWIESGFRGPILYRSRRRGIWDTQFDMLKFRSMVVDADKIQDSLSHLNESDGQLFKMKKDPRITAVGRIIRRFSIDELPQLFNVIRGEMSLVGPRPLPIAQFDRNDVWQIVRLFIRPGITGLWQIRGRSETSFKKMLRLDLFYMQNQTVAMDMWILLKTIPAVMRGRGAW